jgi:hypothetical protein
MAVGHDFFNDGEQPVPEQVRAAQELKASQEKNTFKANDMHSQLNPDHFFKDEPKEESNEESKTEEIKEVQKEEINSEIVAESDGEQSSEIPAEKTQEEIKEEIKELMALYGENEYKLPADAKFKHKIDKEEVEVTVQELLNNYSGKQSWDKKFTELDKERTEYKTDMESVNKYISEFANKSKENPVEALEFLAEQVGLDPFEYRKTLRNQLLNTYGDYLNMDENQRSQFETQERLNYLERQRETDLKRYEQEQTQRELEGRFQGIQQSYGIDNDRRDYLAKELQEVYQAEITPENMLELHNSLSRLDRVDNALNTVNPSFLDDDQKVLTLESLLRGNPEMSDNDLKEMAVKLYGGDVEKAVANLTKKTPAPERKIEKPHVYKDKKNSPNHIDFFND